MCFHPPRREDESMMDHAIRTMDPTERAEAEAAGRTSAERIMAAARTARENAESRRQAAAAAGERGDG